MLTLRRRIVVEVLLLVCIGIVFIYSASAIYAWQTNGDSLFFLKRHVSFVVFGVLMALCAMAVKLSTLQRHSKLLIIISAVLLLLVLVPGLGRQVSGARRWFRFGAFSFQPSEFAQIAVLVYVADFLSRKRGLIRDFTWGVLPVLCVMGGTGLLILVQPDLGSAVAIITVCFLMLFAAGMDKRHLINLILLAIPVAYLLVFSVPYRRMRVLAFLNPWQDPRGSGFQLIQSQVALGAGGLFGVGLGASQQKLFFLPAAHTDFIFSIIGEELGLIGACAIIGLFLVMLWDGFRVTYLTRDPFGYFLSLGLSSLLGLKALINIGVSIGAFPTKGLPLPFISYGGTSLVFDLVAIGLILNVSRSCERA